MSVPWQVAFLALWAVVLLQTGLVLILYRQVGLVYLGQRSARSRDGLPIGASAPPWEAPDQTGRAVRSDAYLGRPLVLAFADPGCGPCQKLFPELRAFYLNHRTEVGVVCIASSSEFENRKMAKDNELEFPVLTQHATTIGDTYAVVATPFLYVIDHEGVIREKGIVNFRTQIEEKLTALAHDEVVEGAQL
jgi:cytochrome c biogenesis protein CcmG, thiol:disulfide interchange protein DsbE